MLSFLLKTSIRFVVKLSWSLNFFVLFWSTVWARVVQVSGFDGNEIFSAKISIYKSFISVFKKFWAKKMLKNFDLSESWKIEFHFNVLYWLQNWSRFENRLCSSRQILFAMKKFFPKKLPKMNIFAPKGLFLEGVITE